MLRTAIVAIIAIILAMAAAAGQDHDHNSEIGRFYERWLMPNEGLPRATSCCNNQDCAAVDGVRRQGGMLQMRRKIDGQWLTIPPEKLESNFDDARDSPDGFSHMCSRGQSVYCAVLGSGI